MSTFSKRLKELRIEKNLTFKELAKIIEVSPATISKWEKQKARTNLKKVCCLAKYFNVSLDYLLGLDNLKHK